MKSSTEKISIYRISRGQNFRKINLLKVFTLFVLTFCFPYYFSDGGIVAGNPSRGLLLLILPTVIKGTFVVKFSFELHTIESHRTVFV